MKIRPNILSLDIRIERIERKRQKFHNKIHIIIAVVEVIILGIAIKYGLL